MKFVYLIFVILVLTTDHTRVVVGLIHDHGRHFFPSSSSTGNLSNIYNNQSKNFIQTSLTYSCMFLFYNTKCRWTKDFRTRTICMYKQKKISLSMYNVDCKENIIRWTLVSYIFKVCTKMKDQILIELHIIIVLAKSNYLFAYPKIHYI